MDAAKIINLKELSESALQAGSYKDAYRYSSSLLEVDPSLREAWMIKAASGAGLMAIGDDVSLEEVMFSLDRGAGGASRSELETTAAIINRTYRSMLDGADSLLKERIVDHHKVPMPQGGSVLLHRLTQKGYARLAAKGLARQRMNAVRLLEKAYDLNPNENNLKFLLNEVNAFFSHSSQYSDYLNDEAEIKSYLENLRSNLTSKAQESGFTIQSTSPKGSGCFIATAATGSYDHPDVVTLRIFRDDILAQSQVGRFFIAAYYRISPPVARWIAEDQFRKNAALRLVVKPLSRVADRLLKIRISR